MPKPLRWNLPLALTVARVLAIPVVLALFYLPFAHARQWACVLYGAACITDWFDGYLARRWNQESKFGAFLDPVADKLMVAVCLVSLLHDPPQMGNVMKGALAAMVAVIIGREITVSALREWMAELGQRVKVSVSWIGKLKTGFQMTAIGMMIWEANYPLGLPWYWMGYWLLLVAAGLTLWSMAQYLLAAWPMMKNE